MNRIAVSPPHPLLAAILVLAIAAPAFAQGSGMTDAIDAELARQEALLRELESGGASSAAPAREANRRGRDPREAPRAPEDRQLPPEIFEEKRVKVPAGRFGDHAAKKFTKQILDADRDGVPELVRWIDPESKLMVHQEADTDYDGVLDAWNHYEWGALVRRERDRNDDGNRDTWETYQRGRMTRREIDRDDDGTRDAFYIYTNDSLSREEHDANGDGKIDLRIEYSNRLRTRAEEDSDKDGRFDLWTTYDRVGGEEIVSSIQRDDRGDGEPDTFETFEPEAGRALLSRREEDLDEDGEIDVVSFFRAGKLVRREIRSADLQPSAAVTRAVDQNT